MHTFRRGCRLSTSMFSVPLYSRWRLVLQCCLTSLFGREELCGIFRVHKLIGSFDLHDAFRLRCEFDEKDVFVVVVNARCCLCRGSRLTHSSRCYVIRQTVLGLSKRARTRMVRTFWPSTISWISNYKNNLRFYTETRAPKPYLEIIVNRQVFSQLLDPWRFVTWRNPKGFGKDRMNVIVRYKGGNFIKLLVTESNQEVKNNL